MIGFSIMKKKAPLQGAVVSHIVFKILVKQKVVVPASGQVYGELEMLGVSINQILELVSTGIATW